MADRPHNRNSTTDFSIIGNYLKRGDTVILVQDDIPTKGTVSQLHHDKRKRNSKRKFEHYIQSGKIVVVPVSYFRYKDEFEPELYTQKLGEIVQKVKKEHNPRSITCIGNCSLMISKVHCRRFERQLAVEDHIHKFIHEQSMNDNIGLNDIICCYNTRTIKRISFSSLVPLIMCHDAMISYQNPKDQIKLDTDRILDCIGRGINNIMGEGADHLIFRTLKMIYGINFDKIVSNPSEFESRLNKIFGSSGRFVLDSISTELRNRVCQGFDVTFAVNSQGKASMIG